MKKQLLLSCFLVLSTLLFTNNSFAQREAGGSADGGTIVPEPCPVSFTRNNGNGTCGEQAEIRIFYSAVPTYAPTLENILYKGEPLLTNTLPITGNIADLASKGYISYCLSTSNIPSAVKLSIVLRYVNTVQPDCVLDGHN